MSAANSSEFEATLHPGGGQRWFGRRRCTIGAQAVRHRRLQDRAKTSEIGASQEHPGGARLTYHPDPLIFRELRRKLQFGRSRRCSFGRSVEAVFGIVVAARHLRGTALEPFVCRLEEPS
jgi:hypothetical protein